MDLKSLSITEHKPRRTHTVNSVISCQHILKFIVILFAGKIFTWIKILPKCLYQKGSLFLEFRVAFTILEQARFQDALIWICISLFKILLLHNLLNHVLSNISESSSITPPYSVFPNIPQYLYQAFLFYIWIFAKAPSRWGNSKMFNVAKCQLFSAWSTNYLGHTFSLSLGSNLLLSLATLHSKSRHKTVKEKQLWEIVFFTGLSRKIMEEKCHLSFEIDYFHSKMRKRKKTLLK